MFSFVWNRLLARSFDAWAPSYDAQVKPMLAKRGYGYDLLADAIKRRLNSDAQVDGPVTSPWLELGTGTGMLGAAMRCRLSAGHILYGLDISAKMLEQANKTGAYDRLFCGTAEQLPFEAASIGACFSAFMMHSVLRRRPALQDVYRVLGPGGAFVLVDLFRTTPRWPIISGGWDNLLSMTHERGSLSRYSDSEEMCRSLRDVGFRIKGTWLLDASEDIARKKVGRRSHGLIVGVKEAQS